MSEKPSAFTVTDRRKFTLEGDLREGVSSSEESAAPQAEPLAQGRGPQLVPDAPVEKKVVNRGLEPLPADRSPSDPFSPGHLPLDEQFHAADDIEAIDDFGPEGMPPEPTAAEHAAQDAHYRASSRQLDDMIAKANPGTRSAIGAGAEMTFDKLVQSIYMTAALQLGAGAQPGEQPRVDILGARQSIDMLSLLTEKTKGNLTDKEQRLLQNALFELRMMFLEITNVIASSAHNPAARPPVR